MKTLKWQTNVANIKWRIQTSTRTKNQVTDGANITNVNGTGAG